MPLGKTGADAVLFFLGHICRTLVRFQSKLLDRIDALETAGTLTSAQATNARLLINSAGAFCAVYKIIADNSGIN
jgi:hypothetical protein